MADDHSFENPPQAWLTPEMTGIVELFNELSGGGMRVMELCAGVSGPGNALLQLGVRAKSGGAWELDPACGPELRSLHAKLYGTCGAVFAGPTGDVLKIDVATLEPCNAIVFGAPCPPFSSLGVQGQWDDPRAKVLQRCLDIVEYHANRPFVDDESALWWWVCEQVEGFFTSGAYHEVRDRMRSLSGFKFNYAMINSQDVGLPQHRVRGYIFGYRAKYFAPPDDVQRRWPDHGPLDLYALAKVPTFPLAAIIKTGLASEVLSSPKFQLMWPMMVLLLLLGLLLLMPRMLLPLIPLPPLLLRMLLTLPLQVRLLRVLS